jgi:phenylalanyl-tRNA synthetase beta chain
MHNCKEEDQGMKVPCRWLSEYVDIPLAEDGVRRLAERLTLAGLEVEGIAQTGRLTGTVIGRVLEHRPHPNSDHLSLCHLDIGTQEVDVVCGAANVVEGALVPVITVGGELPDGLRVTQRKLRGVVSKGMICSKAELGLEEHSPGIWNLDPSLDAPLGTDVADLLEYDDFVLDIKVTSNRPDCLGIYGIAREVAALTGAELRPPSLDAVTSSPAVDRTYAISVEDAEDTPRYTASLMSGIAVADSPLWIQHRLVKAGMRPRSNVVDVTNYVMLELGQPLHPFDADRVREKIVVRRARDGEAFRTLDGVDRALSEEVLMITDLDGGLAVAGVMGGERSEIGPSTTRVLLESAAFAPTAVRRSSRFLGLRSEASHRFEHRVDPQGVVAAARRTANLLQGITGCQVHEGILDSAPERPAPETLRLRPARVRSLLGIDLPVDEMQASLSRLGIETVPDGDAIVATIPSFRADLEREEDLIEEIGRVHGYDRFPSAAPKAVLRVGRKDPREVYKDRVREILTGLGMNEIVGDGFDRADWRRALSLPDDDLVTVRNPMAASQAALRNSLLPGVLAVVETNLNRRVDGGMVFELGRIFSRSRGERESLGGALFGRTGIPLQGKEVVDLSRAKGILDDLLSGLLTGGARFAAGDLPGFLHPGRAARIVHGEETIGLLGELAPTLGEVLPAATRVILFELDIQALSEAGVPKVQYSPVPRFPSSVRDLSLLAPADLPEAQVREAIAAEELVERTLLYDLYQGEQVAEGRKSLTYEVILRAEDRTLTDDEVDAAIARVEKRLGALGVTLRA